MLGIKFINTIVIILLILKQNIYNVEKGLALEMLVPVDHLYMYASLIAYPMFVNKASALGAPAVALAFVYKLRWRGNKRSDRVRL